MLAAVFVAESIPSFGPLLDLMGGSSLSLLNLVFPCLFYLSLLLVDARKSRGDHYPHSTTSVQYWRDVCGQVDTPTLIYNLAIIVMGLVGGVAATYSALLEMGVTNFTPPCYVSLFVGQQQHEGVVGGAWNTTSQAFFTCKSHKGAHPSMLDIRIHHSPPFSGCGASKNISRYGHPEVYCA